MTGPVGGRARWSLLDPDLVGTKWLYGARCCCCCWPVAIVAAVGGRGQPLWWLDERPDQMKSDQCAAGPGAVGPVWEAGKGLVGLEGGDRGELTLRRDVPLPPYAGSGVDRTWDGRWPEG